MEVAAFPDLTLRRLRVVAGLVHDRQGLPVEGARVFQSGDGPIRTHTVSDQQGRFQLGGIIEGNAILVARKDGFRLQGQPIDTKAAAVEVVLARDDEAPAALKTLEGVLPADQEKALAVRLFGPYAERVAENGTDEQKAQMLIALAPIDPARTIELIELKGAGKPEVVLDVIRSVAAAGLAGDSPDEAVSLAETVQEPGARSWCLIDILDKLPTAARARRSELLAQAQLQAGACKQPRLKLRLIGRLADRWLTLGERNRALNLLDEGRGLAKKIPPPGYEITAFAEGLALVQLPEALDLIVQVAQPPGAATARSDSSSSIAATARSQRAWPARTRPVPSVSSA